MALKDRFGLTVSTPSRAALAHYEAAIDAIRLFRGDPVGALDAALAEDPDFALAWAVRATLLAQLTDRRFAGEVARCIEAGVAAAYRANDRERAHLAAADAWARGAFHESTSRFARIAQDWPRDLVAIQNGHMGCFFTGRQADLRDIPLQALRAWGASDRERHTPLGMAAFGFEECGDYARAQAMGEEAVAMEPRDAWAVHAVAHVHEMRGDAGSGIAWLTGSEAWADDCAFAYHNWWHLALHHLERCDHAAALDVYDTKVRPGDSDVLLEGVDASALLWRLSLEGADVGDRWTPLAALWSRAAEDAGYTFNDLHAVAAFLGAGRADDVARTLAAMRKAASGEGDNAVMTREVGLPLVQAFVAFDAGRYAETYETLLPVRGIAQRFGGSHAQRDLISITMLHAALRGGLREAAAALAAERLAHKPQSPWARALGQKAGLAAAA